MKHLATKIESRELKNLLLEFIDEYQAQCPTLESGLV